MSTYGLKLRRYLLSTAAASAVIQVMFIGLSDSAVAQTAAPAQVETVTVTADKKSEDIQNAPVPVTVVDPQSLLTQNNLRLQDYYTSVPGLEVTPRIGS